MWDSRDRAQHDTKKDWPLREELVPCKEKNVIDGPSSRQSRILFPPLHMKIGLIRQFTKAMGNDSDRFTYLCQAFPRLTTEKLKVRIFDGSQIQQLIRDPGFENSMNEVELEAMKAFVLVVKNFLGINKAREYAELVNNMLTAFRNLGCNMRVKMHYLFSHIDQFPENLGSVSDEHVSGSLGRRQDGWQQLESEERFPCSWAFQEFEETEVQALKFEQWWSNLQFTCTYFYQCPPFSLQLSMFLSGKIVAQCYLLKNGFGVK